MKILSPVARKRGRLEIIPLIDIMFFLLASFMMVSLQMQHLMSIKVNLPTATQAKAGVKPDMATITVTRLGQVLLDDRPISYPELQTHLEKKLQSNPNYPVYIQGHKETRHATMIYVLDFVRRAGAQKVAFSVKTAEPK
jgi:biopolymer transport protein ExbD